MMGVSYRLRCLWLAVDSDEERGGRTMVGGGILEGECEGG